MPVKPLLGSYKYPVFLFAFIIVSSCQSPAPDAIGETYLDAEALNVDPVTTSPAMILGRVLFYDRQMSINSTIACASCHKQAFGFADNQKFSRGFESRVTSRNSMPIQNLNNFGGVFEDLTPTSNEPSFGFGNHFFWDGREQDLNSLVLQPVGNHIEMGITDINALTAKISSLPYYAPLFQSAFGTPDVNKENISMALTAFVQSITAFNTKFDRYNASKFNVTETGLTPAKQEIFNSLELEGMMLFQDKYDCNSCHQVQSPTGYAMFGGTFANIGLDKTYLDPGLAGTTGNPDDIGKFRIPSLRNVAFTAPYMHDGRFENLEDVLEHYSEGMADHPNLDDKLKDPAGHAKSMNITEHEKQALIAFLHTLTDESVLTDSRYSNPFKTR